MKDKYKSSNPLKLKIGMHFECVELLFFCKPINTRQNFPILFQIFSNYNFFPAAQRLGQWREFKKIRGIMFPTPIDLQSVVFAHSKFFISLKGIFFLF